MIDENVMGNEESNFISSHSPFPTIDLRLYYDHSYCSSCLGGQGLSLTHWLSLSTQFNEKPLYSL